WETASTAAGRRAFPALLPFPVTRSTRTALGSLTPSAANGFASPALRRRTCSPWSKRLTAGRRPCGTGFDRGPCIGRRLAGHHKHRQRTGRKRCRVLERRMLLPFAILAAVPFVMVLGNSMLIPVFPLLERELSLSQFQVGLLVTAFSVPAGLVIPFAAAMSDHIGRKRIIIPALLLYGAGGLLAGFASLWPERPFAWILAGRIVQGVGAGGTYLIALALAGDWFSGGELPKAVGILEAANGFGKLLSPIAGAALGLVAWHARFFAYGLLALPIAGLVRL